MEVLDDEGNVQLVTGVLEELEDADDRESAKGLMPTPSQVMDAVDLLRKCSGAFEGTKDAFSAFVGYKKNVYPLLVMRMQGNHRFFTEREIHSSLQNAEMF